MPVLGRVVSCGATPAPAAEGPTSGPGWPGFCSWTALISSATVKVGLMDMAAARVKRSLLRSCAVWS